MCFKVEAAKVFCKYFNFFVSMQLARLKKGGKNENNAYYDPSGQLRIVCALSAQLCCCRTQHRKELWEGKDGGTFNVSTARTN